VNAKSTASRARANASSTASVNLTGKIYAPLVQSGGVFCYYSDRVTQGHQ
jgi:hypothetical protein